MGEFFTWTNIILAIGFISTVSVLEKILSALVDIYEKLNEYFPDQDLDSSE